MLGKARELCQALAAEPGFQTIREQLDAFLGDPEIQAQYQELSERGAALQRKQQLGLQLEEAEVAAFEQQREAFLGSPVARGFLDAQQSMQQLREIINRYVTRTFELGRMPLPEDLASCACGGHGCSR